MESLIEDMQELTATMASFTQPVPWLGLDGTPTLMGAVGLDGVARVEYAPLPTIPDGTVAKVIDLRKRREAK